jgi:hypothetical protein
MDVEIQSLPSIMYTKEQNGLGALEGDRLAAERYTLTDWLQKPLSLTELFGVSILCTIPILLAINR